ncbi:MAG: hypothetical protein ACRDYD_04315, partial [Acidimicrobiales bacterium]
MMTHTETLARQLVATLPELEEHRSALAGDWGEEPGPIPLLEELADLVAPRLSEAWSHEALLTRAFQAVEDLAELGDDESD